MILHDAIRRALIAASTLFISHLLCTLIVMYYDLSGKWAKYSLVENRSVISVYDYILGIKSFIADLTFVFIPIMTLCFWHKSEQIDNATDSLSMSLVKLCTGYLMGKWWATAVHYALHHPILYWIHKRHHSKTVSLVASKAWEDSWTEYILMEIPSFCLGILLFPTHFGIQTIFFLMHGYDGAANHSGFAAPGILGYLFNGEYHYYHHRYLNVNYAEVEALDMIFGSHHTQASGLVGSRIAQKQKTTAQRGAM